MKARHLDSGDAVTAYRFDRLATTDGTVLEQAYIVIFPNGRRTVVVCDDFIRQYIW